VSKMHEFYVTRAAEAGAEASAAKLDNVRDRALRSQAAWLDMAARAEQTETDRQFAADAKRDRIAAEMFAG
jgi:hypothetical protein